MSRRVVGLALLAVAAALHWLVAVPSGAASQRLLDEQRQLRAERRELQREIQGFEAQRRAQRVARERLGALPGTPEQAWAELRRVALERLAGAALSDVRLAVRPAGAPLSATLSVSAVGDVREALRYASALTGAGGGLALYRVTLSQRGDGVAIAVDAGALRGRP